MAKPSVGQVACGVLFTTTGVLFAAAQWRHFTATHERVDDEGTYHRRHQRGDSEGGAAAAAGASSAADALESGAGVEQQQQHHHHHHDDGSPNGAAVVSPTSVAAVKVAGASETWRFLAQLVRFDAGALARARQPLQWWCEMGVILLIFHMTDRTGAFASAGKHYSRDLFAFLCLCLLAVSATSAAPCHRGTLLNRDQTDEWKGWMQVLFLLYHYFEAKELYNGIRLCIAAYVWMTGFGNFSYYAVRGDFSAGRVLAQLWRLNFFVALLCCALRNSYMLYYICPMHTLFTLFVYAAMRVRKDKNTSHGGVAVKLGACLAGVLVLWDAPGAFHAVWRPFGALVTYVDPSRPGNEDPLHEWFFRSGLDRFVWIYGMLCAHCHPAAERALTAIDAMPPARRVATRAGVMAASMAVLGVWHRTVYVLPKLQYNALHPYTSWVPITVCIIVRNLWPEFRRLHLGLFAWLGKITLETYLCQFHIWLHTGQPDAQPGRLLVLLRLFKPGDKAGASMAPLVYPLINFWCCTLVYVLISRRVFDLTAALSAVCVPHNDPAKLKEHCVVGATLLGGLAAVAVALQAMM